MTTEQKTELRREHIRYGQEIRLKRAMHRQRIKAIRDEDDARAAAAALIEDPPLEVQSLAIRELLQWCRGIGQAAALRILDDTQVFELRSLGALTDRQRRALTSRLRQLELAV